MIKTSFLYHLFPFQEKCHPKTWFLLLPFAWSGWRCAIWVGIALLHRNFKSPMATVFIAACCIVLKILLSLEHRTFPWLLVLFIPWCCILTPLKSCSKECLCLKSICNLTPLKNNCQRQTFVHRKEIYRHLCYCISYVCGSFRLLGYNPCLLWWSFFYYSNPLNQSSW